MYQRDFCNVLSLAGMFILRKKQYFHELLWDDEDLSQEDSSLTRQFHIWFSSQNFITDPI